MARIDQALTVVASAFDDAGSTFDTLSDASHRGRSSNEKRKRIEAQALVGAYHQEQLRVLLEHVRSALAKLDAGEI